MKGFSVVEIVVSVLILTFLVAGIFMVLNVGDMSYDTDMGLIHLQQQARLAMDGMTRELRQADISADPDGADSITFNAPLALNPTQWIGPITYQLDSNQNQIIRTLAGVPNKILGNNISSLSFDLIGDNLDIELTCQITTTRRRDLSLSLKEKVRLRNE